MDLDEVMLGRHECITLAIEVAILHAVGRMDVPARAMPTCMLLLALLPLYYRRRRRRRRRRAFPPKKQLGLIDRLWMSGSTGSAAS